MKLKREFVVLGGLILAISLVEATVLLYFFKTQLVVSSGQLVLAHWSSVVFMLCLLITGFVLVLMIGYRLTGDWQKDKPRQQETARSKPAQKSTAGKKSRGASRRSGYVKWFNGSKGYGFITNEQGDDVFVHYKSIEGKRRILQRGQEVEYTEKQEGDGLQAHDVTVLDSLH